MAKTSILLLLLMMIAVLIGCGKKRYTVLLDTASEAGTISIGVIKNQPLEIPDNLEKEGYDFIGWYDQYKKKYQSGDIIDSDITLYAKWKIKQYTVKFFDYDGTLLAEVSVDYQSDAEISVEPERIGYRFIGWDQSIKQIESDLSVRAEYEIEVFTVTFQDYDGTVLSIQKVYYNSNASFIDVPYRPGYVFFGWDKSLSRVTSDLTITAIYERATEGLVFTQTMDGYTVSEYHGTDREVIIPPYYNDEPVTAIGTSAFKNRWDLQKVTIPDTVTHIEDQAFYNCDNLVFINLPESIQTIGSKAFSLCTRLKAIEIPAVKIGDSAFYGCSMLESITISENVKEIGSWAFQGCSSLKQIYLSSGVEKIGKNAFSWCQKLATIYTPSENIEHLNLLLDQAGNIYTNFTVAGKD